MALATLLMMMMMMMMMKMLVTMITTGHAAGDGDACDDDPQLGADNGEGGDGECEWTCPG